MSLRPIFGHAAVRERLAQSLHVGKLPASLLFTGKPGVGKQRLALWLAQLLVCDRVSRDGLAEPCGECSPCRYVLRGQHPDVHWFFPRPSIPNADVEDYRNDLRDAIQTRMTADGLWAAPGGSEGIFMNMVRGLIQSAAVRPALAKRAIFIVGDAERMVSQLGSDQAANAFLKLLEEPPPDTTIVLTSSEPGKLLPTIKSRVVTVRVQPVSAAEVAAFLDDEAVGKQIKGGTRGELVAVAAGAPGMLLSSEDTKGAFNGARQMLDAALVPTGPQGTVERVKVAARHGVAGARGSFSDVLDALVVLLHERSRQLTLAGHDRQARRTAQGIVTVLNMKERAQQNVAPNLMAASLVKSLHNLLAS